MNDWFSEDVSPQHKEKILKAAKPALMQNRVRVLKNFLWVPAFAMSALIGGIWFLNPPKEEAYAFLDIDDNESELLAEADFEVIEDLDFLENIESEDL